MPFFPSRLGIAAALLCASALSHAAEPAHVAPKRKFNVAPSADLHYAINARQSGLSLNGDASLAWRSSADSYSIHTETRAAMLGKVIDSNSSGKIDDFGLAPASFVETRWRKQPTATTFNRNTNAITFSSGGESFPLLGGEQDRNSAIWQLIAVARANTAAFKAGSVWEFFVAGPRDAENWRFQVIKEESLTTPIGKQRALHIRRAPPPDAKGQHLDIWLAPALEWYPLRLRFSDGDDDYIEQSLATIHKPT